MAGRYRKLKKGQDAEGTQKIHKVEELISVTPQTLSNSLFWSTMARNDDHDVPPADEETPLLSSQLAPKKPPTTVPWTQVWILLFLQTAEPLSSHAIIPFTPEA